MPVQRLLESLWSAELDLDGEFVGIGVLVFQPRRLFGDFYEEGRVLGGDRHYTHDGVYVLENHQLSGHVDVVCYDRHEPTPLFGDHTAFRLQLRAQLGEGPRRDVLALDASGPPSAERWTRLRLTRRSG